MSTGISVDLNSDLGEGFGPWSMGDDRAMLDIVSCANLACGFHAGDPVIMADTARTARDKGVAIGAHPAFFDLWGFGRRRIAGDSPADLAVWKGAQAALLVGASESLARQVRKEHVVEKEFARPAAGLSTRVSRPANAAREARPGSAHQADRPSRSQAQNAKHPAISAIAAPA